MVLTNVCQNVGWPDGAMPLRPADKIRTGMVWHTHRVSIAKRRILWGVAIKAAGTASCLFRQASNSGSPGGTLPVLTGYRNSSC